MIQIAILVTSQGRDTAVGCSIGWQNMGYIIQVYMRVTHRAVARTSCCLGNRYHWPSQYSTPVRLVKANHINPNTDAKLQNSWESLIKAALPTSDCRVLCIISITYNGSDFLWDCECPQQCERHRFYPTSPPHVSQLSGSAILSQVASAVQITSRILVSAVSVVVMRFSSIVRYL